MNDTDILRFIQTKRPDMAEYYNNTLVGQGYEAGQAGMLAWAKQHFASPDAVNDLNQFNEFVGNPPGTTAGGTAGFTDLVTPGVDVGTADVPNVPGGNYNQIQNANQGGAFTTTGQNTGSTIQNTMGSTNQNVTDTQTGTTTGTQTGTTTGTQDQIGSGTTTKNTTGQQQGTTGQNLIGTTTTGAVDTLGFGSLLKDQAAGVGASDAERSAFLNDVMKTGGTQFGQQLDAGVRQSLSGPRMSGAGDSAQARAAGYAAANVGRENLGQRLQAAGQLAGPTGLSTLSTAANPYIGQQTSTNQNATGFSNLLSSGTSVTDALNKLSGSTTGTSNLDTSGTTANATNQNTSGTTTGLTDLLTSGSESQSGVTAAKSSQAGAGNIPEGQPVKSGSCVLCTAGIELKLPGSRLHRALRRVIAHKLHQDWRRFRWAAVGYFFLFTPLARYLLKHKTVATLLWPLGRAVLYEEVRVSGRRLPLRVGAWAVHWLGHTACAIIGRVFQVPGHVTDPVILEIARREKIAFTVKEVSRG